jgi:hypothetical protein
VYRRAAKDQKQISQKSISPRAEAKNAVDARSRNEKEVSSMSGGKPRFMMNTNDETTDRIQHLEKTDKQWIKQSIKIQSSNQPKVFNLSKATTRMHKEKIDNRPAIYQTVNSPHCTTRTQPEADNRQSKIRY